MQHVFLIFLIQCVTACSNHSAFYEFEEIGRDIYIKKKEIGESCAPSVRQTTIFEGAGCNNYDLSHFHVRTRTGFMRELIRKELLNNVPASN